MNNKTYEEKTKSNPVFLNEIKTKEEFDYELLKGIDDIENGNVKSSDEVDKLIKEKLKI